MDNKKMIKQLFTMFQLIYTHKWSSQIKNSQMHEVALNCWAKALAGIAPQEIEKATEICMREMPWPPSIAEFLDLCERASGAPSLSEAYRLAVKKDFSHPLVKLAYGKLNTWDFGHADVSDSKKMFASAYSEAVRELRTQRSSQVTNLNAPNLLPDRSD